MLIAISMRTTEVKYWKCLMLIAIFIFLYGLQKLRIGNVRCQLLFLCGLQKLSIGNVRC